MRKILIILIIISLLCIGKVSAISASSYVVMDSKTNRVLLSKNMNEKHLIASISKILTSIIVIENTNINDKVLVSNIIDKSEGSGIYIKKDEVISYKDLLYGLMLRSGNDAALVLAENTFKNYDYFIYKMNEYKDNINMKNSNFINPHGLENKDGLGNISTSLDMALLTSYAIKNDTFKEIFGTKKYECTTNKNHYIWNNKNKLLKYDYVTGGKTGYTKKAKRTLVTTGSKNNMDIIIVTLNDPDDWNNHINLYNKIFNEYKLVKLYEKNKNIKNKYYKDKIYIKNDIEIMLSKDEYKDVLIDINIYKLKKYYSNNVVGNISIKIDNKVYYKEPIYIKKG